ncbi:MAG: yraP [Francisellaceae bacterium]|nr:yraP [Francisellaceae bacterium]
MKFRIFFITPFIASLLCQVACLPVVATGALTGASIAKDRRTAGTWVDDKTLTLKAIHLLAKHKTLFKESHINIISYNNVILLLGQTPREEYVQEAEVALSELPNVKKIHNALSVAAPTPLQQRAQDTWITTQIKTKMLTSNIVNPARVKVITENNIVYLMGLLKPDEETEALTIARAIKGVEKVVQVFEDI